MQSIKFLIAIISGSFLITPAFCAPQGAPVASLPLVICYHLVSFRRTKHLRVLVDLYTEADYGGTKYYAASGLYSTCLGIPADLGTVVNSIKLGPNVKKCTLFDDASCNKVKGKYKVYSKDQPNVTLSPVWSIECEKK
jgi:hypothetical protein